MIQRDLCFLKFARKVSVLKFEKGHSGHNAESGVVQSLLLPEGFFRVSRFFPLSLNGHFICSSLICFFRSPHSLVEHF